MATGVASPKHLVLFDGTCDLCDGAMALIARRDTSGVFRMEPLQSDLASSALAGSGIDPATSETAIVVANWQSGTEEILQRSAAVEFVARRLGFPRLPLALLRCVPRIVLDWLYDRVARNRGRFGRNAGSCAIADGD